MAVFRRGRRRAHKLQGLSDVGITQGMFCAPYTQLVEGGPLRLKHTFHQNNAFTRIHKVKRQPFILKLTVAPNCGEWSDLLSFPPPCSLVYFGL